MLRLNERNLVRLFSAVMLTIALASCAKKETVKEEAKEESPKTVVEAKKGKVWVVKPDGSKSCGMKKGIPLPVAVKEMQAAGVQVLKSQKAHDGKMRMMVCGADTGQVLRLLIHGKDYPQAVELGYFEAD